MKIDILYSFHFDGAEQSRAINRLITSIYSIKHQGVNVCVCDTSYESICTHIDSIADKYYHEFVDIKPYCKSKTINLGVDHIVRTPYFLMSDIDIIYPPNFVKIISEYIEKPGNYRVVFYNRNVGLIQTFGNDIVGFRRCDEEFARNPDRTRTPEGIAPGNGLVNLDSFKLVKGFDENFRGYGWEDADFNKRIKKINTYVEDKNPQLKTYHLYHRNPGVGTQPEYAKPRAPSIHHRTFPNTAPVEMVSEHTKHIDLISEALKRAGLPEDFGPDHPDWCPSKRQRYAKVMADISRKINS